MGDVWHRIDDGLRSFELVEGPFVEDGLEAGEAIDVLRWVDLDVEGLRYALAEAGLDLEQELSVEQLRDHVEDLVRSERLFVRRVEQPRPVVTHELPAVDLTDLLPSDDEPEITRERSWIDFRLVDEDGDPVAGHRFRLELPNGQVITGRTDAAGRYRLGNLDPGGEATLSVDPGR